MSLRNKAIITSVTIPLLVGIMQFLDLSNYKYISHPVTQAAVLSIIFMFLLNWVLNFNLKGIKVVTLLFYATFLVFIFSLFLELIIFQNVGRITEKTISFGILSLFAVVVYFLILTINILNVSYISQIPLVRAAKASNFLFTLFGAYFAFLLISRSGVLEPIKVGILTSVVYLLTLNILSFKKESYKQLFGEAGAVTFMMFSLFLVSVMWPINAEVFAMSSIILFYVMLNLGLEERENATLLMQLEYFLLIVLVVILLLISATWGINGTII